MTAGWVSQHDGGRLVGTYAHMQSSETVNTQTKYPKTKTSETATIEKMKRRITTTRKYTSPCALTILHQIDTRLMGRTKDIPGTTIRLSTVNQGRMTCTTRVTIHHKTRHRADDTNTLQPPSQLHMRNL
jgi:hypothetical protein